MADAGQPQGTGGRMNVAQGIEALLGTGTTEEGGQPETEAEVQDIEPEVEQTPMEGQEPDDADAPDDEPASEDALEADDGSEDESDDEVEPDDDDSSAIEPPQHWSEDQKARFREMPQEAQEFVLERNRETDRAFTQKTEELANERKQLNQELQGLQQERQQYAQYLQQLEQTLQQPEQEPDWQRLYNEDPDEYNRQRWAWQDRKDRLQQVQAEQQRVAEENRRQQQQALQHRLQQEQQRLLERLPHWQEPEKAKKEKQAVMEYAKSVGFTDQELARAYDSRAVEMMWKAMKYDNLQSKKPEVEKKVRKAPKMSKGGQPSKGNDTAKKRERQAFNQFAKSGKKEDAVDYLLSRQRKG